MPLPKVPRHVVFEEGPLADWLVRGLRPHAGGVTACGPHRNALVAKEPDKDDPIDGNKLGCPVNGGVMAGWWLDVSERVKPAT